MRFLLAFSSEIILLWIRYVKTHLTKLLERVVPFFDASIVQQAESCTFSCTFPAILYRRFPDICTKVFLYCFDRPVYKS